MKIYEEFCFAGACNRGVCYLGCIKKLEEDKILNFKKIVGVSIGAFIAACYIIGYTTDEMLEIIIQKDTKEFKDISLMEVEGAILKGEQYRKWVLDIISKKIDPWITLEKLYQKTEIELIIIATCIYSVSEEFNEGINYFDHKRSPNVPLIIAIMASMALPFIFPPINYKDSYFIDGGVLDNFPLDQVSEQALGLRVTFTPIDGSTSTKSPISYIGKLFELISLRMKHLNPGLSKLLVNIKCDDFSLYDFEMTIDDKITLYKRGYDAMSDFLIETATAIVENEN